MDALHEPALSVTSGQETAGGVRALATVEHPGIAFSLMNTFEGDKAVQQGGFNDRVYVQIPLRSSMNVGDVTATATGKETLSSRVVGAAVESWQGERRLHVQVDLPSTGYQKGPIRKRGANVEIVVKAGP
jgi:hypothetical protein